MRHAVFDTILTPIKEVVPCPTASNPHKVKVRIMKDDTWITLWFWYTPWQLMQQTDAAEAFSMASLSAAAGIPLTREILVAGADDFDYLEGSEEPVVWFEV